MCVSQCAQYANMLELVKSQKTRENTPQNLKNPEVPERLPVVSPVETRPGKVGSGILINTHLQSVQKLMVVSKWSGCVCVRV